MSHVSHETQRGLSEKLSYVDGTEGTCGAVPAGRSADEVPFEILVWNVARASGYHHTTRKRGQLATAVKGNWSPTSVSATSGAKGGFGHRLNVNQWGAALPSADRPSTPHARPIGAPRPLPPRQLSPDLDAALRDQSNKLLATDRIGAIEVPYPSSW